MEIFSFKGRLPIMTNFVTQFLSTLFLGLLDRISETGNQFIQVIVYIISLVLIWISFATLVKRSHDIGKSAWFPLLPFSVLVAYVILVALAGGADSLGEGIVIGGGICIFLYLFIVLLIVTFKAGDKGPNMYGLVPPPFGVPPAT